MNAPHPTADRSAVARGPDVPTDRRAFRDWCRAAAADPSPYLKSFDDLAWAARRLVDAADRLGGDVPGEAARAAADEIGTWMAAMIRRDSTAVFGDGPRLHDGPRPDDDLIGGLGALSPDLHPLFRIVTGGRLSAKLADRYWLPEAWVEDETAGRLAMMPQWDRRRGRIDVDYSAATMRIEIGGGRTPVVTGRLTTETTVDGHAVAPEGPWEVACRHTDDEVHYVEWEQPFGGGAALQRQAVVLRDERIAVVADAVVAAEDATIRHELRLPVFDGVELSPDADINEWRVLRDGKPQGLVVPLACDEWRCGRSSCSADVDAGTFRVATEGRHRIYSPVWFDLYRRRLRRPRTWRRLTVGEDLRTCRAEEASAFRVQSGSQHWMMHRSFSPGSMRTVLGRHTGAEFLLTRFDPGEGTHEPIVTVTGDG